VKEFRVLDRPPISSDFIKDLLFNDVNAHHQGGLRSLSQKPSARNSVTLDFKQISTLSVRSPEDSLSNTAAVEILSEFKGPLIDKDGNLYIDEEYDQTYKKRLRNKEI
jgi:hypothetical protein